MSTNNSLDSKRLELKSIDIHKVKALQQENNIK